MSTDDTVDEQDQPDWVSHRAVAWVLDDAPVPADLAWTLTVIARRCDKYGRGSRQAAKTIAAKAGKSPKQAQRDIVRLRKLGLLIEGDQSLVAHLPPGKRPTVYDVPLDLKGPKPVKESRNKSGLKKDALTPPTDRTPPMQGTPPMDGESTPPFHGVPRPPMEGRQKKTLNNPLNNPSLSGARPQVPSPRVSAWRERDEEVSRSTPKDLPHRLAAKYSVPDDKADYAIDWITGAYSVGGDGWWIKADSTDTLQDRFVEALDDHDAVMAERARDAAIEEAKAAPACKHGCPGGTATNPETGLSWFCAVCRYEADPRQAVGSGAFWEN